jgi:hypothetical protein
MLRLSTLAAALAASTAHAGYVLDAGWPSGMPAASYQLSAVGVDPFVVGGAEVYVAQRGANLTQPILVFNEAGELVRSFGAGHIARDDKGVYGCHGLSVRSAMDSPTQIWVNDFDEYTTKVFSPTGDLLATLGQADTPGAGTLPLQFDKVADTDFGADGAVFISDGDGSSNHRVIALNASDLAGLAASGALRDASKLLLDSSYLLWVGGNNNTPTAFGTTVLGLPLQSMHSVAHHARTNTIFAVDRENNRTLHVDGVSQE